MKKLICLFCFTMLLVCGSAWAIPNLKLPFGAGLSWYMTRGYNTGTHIKYTNIDDSYALDFADSECDFVNSSALAASKGKVITAHMIDDNAYGKYIIIDHGDGYTSRYAHLNLVSVSINEDVVQGQVIGKVGNTGNVVGNCSGAHLHFALYHNNGTSVIGVKPEPMSGYINFTEGQTYISNNYFTDFNFNDGASQGWMPGNDARNIPFVSTRSGTWTVGASDFDGVGGAHPGVLSPIFNGISTDHFSSLRFTVKISTQLSGAKQGDIWIKTSDGDWNHNFIFTHISNNRDGFHTYQAAFTAGIALNQISIELTKNNVYEEWEFDEIRLMGRKPMAPNLKIMNWH